MANFDNKWGIKVKKELAELWPPLSAEEFEDLKKSIAENGLLEPIVVNENHEVIEGHQRLLAWISLGKDEPPVIRIVKTGGDLAKEIALSVEYNARRRHLVKSELAIIVAKAFKMIEELTQKKVFPWETVQTSNTSKDLEKESLGKIAEKVGISKPTLSKALKVVEKGTPEVQKAVEKGELSVKRAYEIVQHPPEEQKKLLEKSQEKRPEESEERHLNKSKWLQVFSAFEKNPSRETVERLASEHGVSVDEVIRVVNFVLSERGKLPISLSALAEGRRAVLEESKAVLEERKKVAPTVAGAGRSVVEEDEVVITDEYVIAGIRVFARIRGERSLSHAAATIIMEHLVELGLKW